MTTLSKEDVVRTDNDLLAMIQKHFPSLPLDDRYTDWGKWLRFAKAVYSHGEQAARADLVAENERLKEMAMFFSTYTDPDELEMDEIENAARESFRRANSGVRGTTITRANSYESHVIWATKARISKELTATRTALAAAEARESATRAILDQVMDDIRSEAFLFDGGNWISADTEDAADNLLDQPRDDSALREMIAGVYEECAKVCEDHPDGLNMMGGAFVSCSAAIRALAEKAKGE